MKLILDLDTGVDDALALSLALASPEAELIGVTAVFGNVARDLSARNSLALCALLGRPDVPVYRGCDRPRGAQEAYVATQEVIDIHGANGLGEVATPDAERAPEEQDAVSFIIDAVNTYGKDLVLVPTGPLTTIAAALERDPSVAEKIGKIVLMGGALTVCGNVSPCAEANIANDPEAANIVFTSGAPITMIGLDVTHRTFLSLEEAASWKSSPKPAGALLADIATYYMLHEAAARERGGCVQHDPLAVATALDPSLVRTIELPLQVDTEGAFRGRTIGCNERLLTGPYVNVAVEVDAPRFERLFRERISTLLDLPNNG